MRSRSITGRIAAALLMFGPAMQAYANDDILIGLHGPLTGPASWIGLGSRDGALLALEEINAAGGVNGHKLKLVAYDEANKPSEAEAVAKKLAESDKVFAIVGGGASNTGVVVAKEAARMKVPYLNSTAASPKIMDGKSKWVFSVAAPDARDQAEDEAGFVGHFLKAKNVAVLHSSEEFPVSFVDQLTKLLKEKYDTDIGLRERFNRGDTDFSAQLIAVRQANPDLLLLSGPYIECARIIRQARELGIKTQIKADAGAMNTGLLTIAGPAAEGLYISYVTPYFNGDPSDAMVKFETRYRQAYPDYPPERPNYLDINAYGTMYVLAEGLKRAGAGATQKQVVEALETLDKFKASQSWPDSADIIFPVSFTERHAGNRRLALYRVTNGAFASVPEYSVPEPSTPLPANGSLDW